MNQLESLLFGKKTRKNGVPLFNRHVDVVKALLSTSTSEYYLDEQSEEYLKRFNNLKVYLSKVLARRTKPSEDFITSLNVIVKNALEDENDQLEALKELNKLLVPITFMVSDNDSHAEELNRRYGNSKTQITFISRPVETYNNTRATQFIDLILDSVFIFNGTLKLSGTQSQYEFHFAHYLVAHEFFDKLYLRTLERLNIPNEKLQEGKEDRVIKLRKEVEELFIMVNENILTLYAVDELYCTLPVTVFNHTSQDACGFAYFSHDANKFSIAKMSDAAINRWYKNLYLRAKFTRHEIDFSTYLKVKKILNEKKEIIDFNSLDVV